jgi:crossover junction endodeoxyribonuclease RuvC
MRILGIDPGLAIVGYGIVDYYRNSFRTVAYGAIETPAGIDVELRIEKIYDTLMEIIDKYSPTDMAIEELFFNTNAKTAILVGQARGVAILACVKGGLEIEEYTPLQIKQALTGNGRAEKKQVQFMVKNILGLDAIPKPDDAADALAVALTHMQTNSIISDNSV